MYVYFFREQSIFEIFRKYIYVCVGVCMCELIDESEIVRMFEIKINRKGEIRLICGELVQNFNIENYLRCIFQKDFLYDYRIVVVINFFKNIYIEIRIFLK